MPRQSEELPRQQECSCLAQTLEHSSTLDPTIILVPAMLPSRLLGVRSFAALRHPNLRFNSTLQQPNAQPNRHGSFYKNFGPPILKNFLIALCTFQAIYWSWMKMESMEVKKNGDEEVRAMENELKRLTGDKLGK